MQRLSTTVVAVVGTEGPAALASAAGAMNVRVVPPTGDPVATWREVVRTRRPFCLIGDDPLEEVAQAWTALFADRQATGRLEVAVHEVGRQVRSGAVDLPDFYLTVGDADFHLAALQPVLAARVVPVAGDVLRTVSRLGAGRWWPPLDRRLADLDRRLPDRFAAPQDGQDGTGLLAVG